MSALTLFEHPAPPAPRIRDGGLLATKLAGKHAALITGHFLIPGREVTNVTVTIQAFD